MNPFKIKKGLGRGLSSLIGDTEITKSQSKLSISSIVRNKYQPRKIFDKESLEDLTASIKERGIIQPIIVRKSKLGLRGQDLDPRTAELLGINVNSGVLITQIAPSSSASKAKLKYGDVIIELEGEKVSSR